MKICVLFNGFPLIKLAKKLKENYGLREVPREPPVFPLIKLAKKLKANGPNLCFGR